MPSVSWKMTVRNCWPMPKRPKLPKHIILAPRVMEIRFDDKLSEAAGVLGAAMADTEIILLDPAQGPNVMRDTVLHEILHVLFGQAVSPKLGVTIDQEEQIVAGMSPHLLNFLRNNAECVIWMVKSDGK